jgi:hypothetical protein
MAAAAQRPGVAEIWVAAGRYTPAPPNGDRAASFRLTNGLTLYGGFAGGETQSDQRDPATNVTILSGDLNGDDDEPKWIPTAENSSHVVVASGTDATAVLDGFTITGGNADDAGGYMGAGILNVRGSPTIRACLFYRNSAYEGSGGGMANRDHSDPALIDCTFRANYAFHGAGVFNDRGSRPTLRGCVFTENQPTPGAYYGSGYGIAIADQGASASTVIDCTFANNRATGGGAVGTSDDSLFVNCAFIGNRADDGGAARLYGTPTFINCLFSGNNAQSEGGAIDCGHGSPSFVNCTFYGNSARTAGVVRSFGAPGSQSETYWARPVFTNCILWGNGPTPILDQYHAATTVTCSCIEGGWSGAGTGNIASDPLFVDPAGPDGRAGTPDDNLRLRHNSPCIDAGDNAALPADITTDLGGSPRMVYARVDMGAYEYIWRGAVDFDADADVDLTDFGFLQACFNGPNRPPPNVALCAGADLDVDGDVDLRDFFGFQACYNGPNRPPKCD